MIKVDTSVEIELSDIKTDDLITEIIDRDLDDIKLLKFIKSLLKLRQIDTEEDIIRAIQEL